MIRAHKEVRMPNPNDFLFVAIKPEDVYRFRPDTMSIRILKINYLVV
jgi:hypothetical protein